MAGALVSPKGITKSPLSLLVRLLACHTGRLWLVSFRDTHLVVAVDPTSRSLSGLLIRVNQSAIKQSVYL